MPSSFQYPIERHRDLQRRWGRLLHHGLNTKRLTMFVLWVRLLLDRRYRSWVTGWIRCSGFSSIHFALSANSLNVWFQFSVLTYFILRRGSVAARHGRAAAAIGPMP